jgi:hypothetical protein
VSETITAAALDAALAEAERAILAAADELADAGSVWHAPLAAGRIRYWALERRRLLAEADRLTIGPKGEEGEAR